MQTAGGKKEDKTLIRNDAQTARQHDRVLRERNTKFKWGEGGRRGTVSDENVGKSNAVSAASGGQTT